MMRHVFLIPLLLAACVRAPAVTVVPAPVVVVTAPAGPVVPPAPAATGMRIRVSEADAELLRERLLMVPVAGIRPDQVRDTYDAPRGGGRVHRAIDILAPRGTAVVAADDGLVHRVRSNAAGGLTVYMFDPARRLVYYYAHLDAYAEGVKEGVTLAKGDVLGYVGTTGNAPRSTPHLHFQVMRLDDVKKYWGGTPLDPRPFFAHDGRPTNAPDQQAAR